MAGQHDPGRQRFLDLLRQRLTEGTTGPIDANEVGAEAGVSPQEIENILKELNERKVLLRDHAGGGVIVIGNAQFSLGPAAQIMDNSASRQNFSLVGSSALPQKSSLLRRIMGGGYRASIIGGLFVALLVALGVFRPWEPEKKSAGPAPSPSQSAFVLPERQIAHFTGTSPWHLQIVGDNCLIRVHVGSETGGVVFSENLGGGIVQVRQSGEFFVTDFFIPGKPLCVAQYVRGPARGSLPLAVPQGEVDSPEFRATGRFHIKLAGYGCSFTAYDSSDGGPLAQMSNINSADVGAEGLVWIRKSSSCVASIASESGR
jgi:hypothetical protein